ncbi:MAG: hypothetical protein R3F14_43440 [Polyangiaceae bacterium]
MKATTCLSLLFVGALLQGCVQGSSTTDIDDLSDDAADVEEIETAAPRSAVPAPESVVDAKIARVAVPGGEIVFVDEALTEPGGGISFWELGDADLSYLLDDQNATAAEVFIALTPEGTPVPARLVEHHAEVARRVGGIPAQPRRLAVPLSLGEYTALTNQGLTDGGSETDKDCWAWAGTTNPYSTAYGYQSFNQTTFRDNFYSQYSQISGANVSGNVESANSLHEESELGPTAAGHERAMAFCLSKAMPANPQDSLYNECYGNEGRAQVVVSRTTDSTYQSYSTADSITLESFGHGGRFRSNYTNSGGGARKYKISVLWLARTEAPGCLDEIVLAWRSKWISNGTITF